MLHVYKLTNLWCQKKYPYSPTAGHWKFLGGGGGGGVLKVKHVFRKKRMKLLKLEFPCEGEGVQNKNLSMEEVWILLNFFWNYTIHIYVQCYMH